MIGYDELSLMKPTAFFINTSRGGTYKESDLARAPGGAEDRRRRHRRVPRGAAAD
jgi:hypothetical protein